MFIAIPFTLYFTWNKTSSHVRVIELQKQLLLARGSSFSSLPVIGTYREFMQMTFGTAHRFLHMHVDQLIKGNKCIRATTSCLRVICEAAPGLIGAEQSVCCGRRDGTVRRKDTDVYLKAWQEAWWWIVFLLHEYK